ncbi:MAG TPA: hypothetical protein VH331_16310 [Allosphingosinicella sp.]|jgi:hypothetical protein|nr:hypothetical protein [Allosphingosinicella sp.]
MHLHLPKPLHGWREFVGEVGIIVLGVLIALGAEQVAEKVHERSQIGELQRALRSELADSRARWEDMRAEDSCESKRLDALERWLAAAPATSRLPAAFSPMLWNMHSSAWDLAKTSPAANSISLHERLIYASLYDAINNWRSYLDEERNNAVQLNALIATANQPEHRHEAALRIDVARQYVRRRQRNYTYFFTRLDQLRIAPDASQLTIAHDPHVLCQPLPAAVA